MRKTQKQIVKELLRQQGKVDNFYCIENKITIRLGAIIERIRSEDGWVIEGGYKDGTKNWEYRLMRGPKHLIRVEYVERDGIQFARPIYGN